MNNSTYHIWYRGDGVILAIGRPVTHKDLKLSVEPVTEPHHNILEVELSRDLVETLHTTHRVDIGTKTLVESSGDAPVCGD